MPVRVAINGLGRTAPAKGSELPDATSALLRHGPEHATVLLDGLSDWMARKGFRAVDELRGMLSVPADTDAAEYERAGYVSAMRAANAGAWEFR
jgi:dihydroorotate dehydrogenase (fumarate)